MNKNSRWNIFSGVKDFLISRWEGFPTKKDVQSQWEGFPGEKDFLLGKIFWWKGPFCGLRIAQLEGFPGGKDFAVGRISQW